MEKLTVSSSILEKMLGVSDRRVRQLVEDGILVRVSKGKYDLVTSVANYIRFLKLANELEKKEESETLDYDLEHAKNERVKRQQNEIKLKLMQGKVFKADQIEAFVTDMLINFRTRIMIIPEKLTPMLVGQKNNAYVKKVLSDEVIEALNELKDFQTKDYVDDTFVDFEDDEEDFEEGVMLDEDEEESDDG